MMMRHPAGLKNFSLSTIETCDQLTSKLESLVAIQEANSIDSEMLIWKVENSKGTFFNDYEATLFFS